MIRILFLGDLAPTGFGSVTRGLGGDLVKLPDVDIRFISQNAYGDDLEEPFRSRTVSAESLATVINVLAGEFGSMASDVIGPLLSGTSQATLVDGTEWGDWKPDAAILLGDYKATKMFTEQVSVPFPDPTLHYCPVEGTDLPPRWAQLWQPPIYPIAMSKFGAGEIGKVVGHEVPMVYHGVDTTMFHPVSPKAPVILRNADTGGEIRLTSREDCLKLWAAYFTRDSQIPLPKVWALRTDRHMPRKRYNSLLRAMVPVLARRPEVGLVIHCRIDDQGGNLEDTISKIPGHRQVLPEGVDRPRGYAILNRPYPQIILVNAGGVDPEALCALYNAAELYVTVSAEGFGLTIAEALACGTPALGPDYSAVPEVIGPAGQVVPVGLVDNEYDHAWCAVNEPEFGRQAEFLLTHQERRRALGRKGPPHIALSFRWRDAAGTFVDLIRRSVEARWQTSSPSQRSAITSASPAPPEPIPTV